MRREFATITFGLPGESLGIWTELDVDELVLDNPPMTLEGIMVFEVGSTEDRVLHSTDANMRIWFLGNRLGYRFAMAGDGPRFTATRVS